MAVAVFLANSARAETIPVGGEETAATESASSTSQRLLKKAEAAVAEIERRVEAGRVPQNVIDELQKLDGLMTRGEHAEAEALLDDALRTLGLDPEDVLKQTGRRPAPESRSSPVDKGPLPRFDPTGFTSIFDGKTLNDWDGDPKYWTVEEGKLVGRVTPETLLPQNSWILWRGGLVEDFELVVDYRVSAQGNSGVGYRLAVLDGQPFGVRGPQGDIHGGNMFSGICYEENGRRLLAARGQSTWIDDPGAKPRLIAQFGDPEELQGVVRKEDWNRYRLLVRGTDAKHFINGVLMSEVHDHDQTNRMHRGLLGVQVHVGPPMKIEYRDIYLRLLSQALPEDTDRASVTYCAGDLLELEHPPSFEHFVQQTARLTAPVEPRPVDDRGELEVITRNLGIVRHDLADIKLFGVAKTKMSDEQAYDLVVMSRDLRIRVPKAGFRLIGKPMDREYRVRLRWNQDLKQYDLIDLSPGEPAPESHRPLYKRSYRMAEPKVLRDAVGPPLPQWADAAHTFLMLPTRPERAKELNVSVNGAWGGIPGKYSMLPHHPHIQRDYNYDQRAFADDLHRSGLLVTAAINTIEGLDALREVIPDLDQMACRNAAGELIVVGGQMTLMCSLNPDWVRHEIESGKAAIDAGADWILVDTPMGASFISGFLKAGFCRHCMSNFEAFMKEVYSPSEMAERFGVTSFSSSDIAQRLTAMQHVAPRMSESPHAQTHPDALLFQQFARCQEETNFASRRALLETLHEYAKQKDRQVLFCTNAADLGTQNPGGHWIRGLMFADLVDLFTYEMNYDTQGAGARLTRLPRGKWAAFHKLAYAIHHRRSAALLHTQDLTALVDKAKQGASFLSWMGVQAVEAYAANGSYVPFHAEIDLHGQIPMERVWSRVFEHNRFVQQHQGLYRGPLVSGSPVALLFLLNERGRTIPAVFPSYLGLAQGFVDGNYPFDVVFAGDGRYVKDRLSASQLAPYSTLVVPSPIDPTENQKELVQEFARAGGVVVCHEPDRLGLDVDASVRSGSADFLWSAKMPFGRGEIRVLAGDVSLTETGDIGSQFFRQYTAQLRGRIAELATDLGLTPSVEGESTGLLSAFPVVQQDRERLIVHLVNYDIDYDNDTIRPQNNVRLRLPLPTFLRDGQVATLHRLDDPQPSSLAVEVVGDSIRCTVSDIAMGAVLVISRPDHQQ